MAVYSYLLLHFGCQLRVVEIITTYINTGDTAFLLELGTVDLAINNCIDSGAPFELHRFHKYYPLIVLSGCPIGNTTTTQKVSFYAPDGVVIVARAPGDK